MEHMANAAPVESIETLKRYFEHVFANSRDIMNLFSLTQGRVMMLNAEAERATGYSLPELQDLPVAALYPAEEHAKLQVAFEKLRDTGFSSDKLCMYARNGELRDIWTRSYIVQRVPETICIVHTIDITDENRKRERELRDAKLATLGQASATLAHELKNALQSMQFSLSTLRGQLTESGLGRAAGSLARLERAASHMDDVITGIEKSTVRTMTGAAYISVPAAVQNAVLLMRGYLTAKGIECSSQFEGALPLVWCDQAQLEQILVVLIKNAAQAMASRDLRKLSISICNEGAGLRLDVTDTGGGLPADIQPRLFEAFSTTKPLGLGHGLGLATAKQLALDNELEMSFATQPGVGTTFSLGFRSGSETDARRDSTLLGGRVVLVLSDDPALIAQSQNELKEAGARTLFASSAAEGIQLLRVHSISAIICDDAMYPVNGRQFVAQARELYRGPVCLVVNNRADYPPNMLVGVDSVISKPVLTRDLVVLLDALLA
ncbi:MAG: diguanylate cyclase/phosphodiesterase [Myxococcaceae bacterium]|nr:diguanylate cyclase/phosphodiesterase [Myxococcaceae bacterium]